LSAIRTILVPCAVDKVCGGLTTSLQTLPPQSPSVGKSVAVLSPSLKKTHASNKGVAGASDQKSLYTGPIDTSWPPKSRVGRGFNNVGNTCFLNSALQCLLHTPPLVRILFSHKESCAFVRKVSQSFLETDVGSCARPGQEWFLYDVHVEADDGREPVESYLPRSTCHRHKVTAYATVL
jgi:hypothetical protein